LSPLSTALEAHFAAGSDGLRSYTALPDVMTDLLLQHPQMAALFQQALQGDRDSTGNQLIKSWLDKLLVQGSDLMETMGFGDMNRAELAIQLIAMFNLCTGYFLSQRAFETLAEGQITDPENIARQKKLLRRVIRTFLL
jgi:hypothetical protein